MPRPLLGTMAESAAVGNVRRRKRGGLRRPPERASSADLALLVGRAEILTPDEAASILKLPTNTIVQLCARGDIPGARKVGRRWRFPAAGIASTFEVRGDRSDDAGLQERQAQVEGSDLVAGPLPGLDRAGEEVRRRRVRGPDAGGVRDTRG